MYLNKCDTYKPYGKKIEKLCFLQSIWKKAKENNLTKKPYRTLGDVYKAIRCMEFLPLIPAQRMDFAVRAIEIDIQTVKNEDAKCYLHKVISHVKSIAFVNCNVGILYLSAWRVTSKAAWR